MAPNFEYTFDTAAHKGKTSFSTGLFIDGKFVDGSKGTTIEYVPSLSPCHIHAYTHLIYQCLEPMYAFLTSNPFLPLTKHGRQRMES